jgi:hypothetical protein
MRNSFSFFSLFSLAASFLMACTSAPEPESVFADSDVSPALPMPGPGPSPDEACSAGAPCDIKDCAFGTPTAQGCEVSYDIRPAGTSGMATHCNDSTGNIYNGCSSTPVGFRWTDVSNHPPKSVKIEMQPSVFCQSGLTPDRTQAVSLNGTAVGSFQADPKGCWCGAKPVPQVFDLTDEVLADYHEGRENVLQINGPNRCFGMQQNAAWGGSVARVTVVY